MPDYYVFWEAELKIVIYYVFTMLFIMCYTMSFTMFSTIFLYYVFYYHHQSLMGIDGPTHIHPSRKAMKSNGLRMPPLLTKT